MAEHRFFRSEEPQVDPFNAGEPELPWTDGGEPSADEGGPVGGEGGRGAEPDPTDVAGDDAAGGAAAGAGEEGPRADGYVAPTRPDSGYDAPSTEERRDGPSPRSPLRPAPGQAAALRVRVARRKRLLRTLIVIILVVSFAAPVASCVGDVVGGIADATGDVVGGLFADDGDVGGGWSGAFSDSGVRPPSPAGDAGAEDDGAVRDALEARLEVLLADPSTGMLHELVAGSLSDRLLSLLGYTPDELGIDADAWATWYLGQVSFEMDSAYADDGSGTAYAYVTAPNVSAIVWDFYDEVSDYLLDNDLWGHYGSADGAAALPSAGQREHVRSAFDEATAAAGPGEPLLASAYVNYLDGEWVVDEQDLVSSLSGALGL